MPDFDLIKRLQKHDEKHYGAFGAALLRECMSQEINGYCFKMPEKKAAAMFNLDAKQFRRLVIQMAQMGALCIAGNAIISNPHRRRFRKPLDRYSLHHRW